MKLAADRSVGTLDGLQFELKPLEIKTFVARVEWIAWIKEVSCPTLVCLSSLAAPVRYERRVAMSESVLWRNEELTLSRGARPRVHFIYISSRIATLWGQMFALRNNHYIIIYRAQHTFQCWCGIVTHLGIMPTTQDETYKSWSWYKYRPLLTELITRQELSSCNAWTESGHEAEYLSVGSGRTTSRWWALNMLWRGPVLTLSSA